MADRITPKSGYTGTHFVHLNDDAPALGSGRRRVDVTVGRKYVHLVTCGGPLRRAKLTRDHFEEVINSPANRESFACANSA